MRTHSNRAFTLIELLVVIGLISFLIAAMAVLFSKIRQRVRRDNTQALLQKIANGLEAYKLYFHTYPPDTQGGQVADQALRYYLSSAFRVNPDPLHGEILASTDAGPLVEIEPAYLRPDGGLSDGWGVRLHYELKYSDADNQKAEKENLAGSLRAGSRQQVRQHYFLLYSLGPDGLENGGTGDDILFRR